MNQPLLSVKDLGVGFETDEGMLDAVRGVSFDVMPGQTIGIVGESGSGKSVTNLAMMGLIPMPPGKITSGQAMFAGNDLLTMSQDELSKIRGRRIAMIFQDPMTALNPFLTVEDQLTEVTRLHLGYSRRQAKEHAIEMLTQVGISAPEKRLYDYPHQFSGGMRQRVMIAIALSCNPEILIADEPTTALDVTIQAQILDLLKKLQREHNTAIIMITHDLGVVANICHEVLVMYAGRIVEKASAEALFATPRHPYTEGLMNSIPRWDQHGSELLKAIEGQPPHLAELPAGCAFHPRCPYKMDRCVANDPRLEPIPSNQDREKACFADLSSK
ncbi:MAG: ABC transporter ATP-binding protein [Pirellulaceae bacterium]